MSSHDDVVTYEAFGAAGDGVNDDLPAICAAHEDANARGLPVRSRPDATYHLGGRALTAIIATDTDWNTSRFTIDDAAAVENHKTMCFEVRSLLAPLEVQISRLSRDQKQTDARPVRDCHVRVENDTRRRYIRRGANRNQGVPQHDCFVLRRDGSIEGDVDWDYDAITRLVARPIDETPLRVRGGVFTTIANRMKQEAGYNYWGRGILISRSNTDIEGLTHYVAGETAVGHPYRGFLSAEHCANVTLRDGFVTGHRIYSTIGAAGVPVNMGSYDVSANSVVNFRMVNCRMNHLCDRTRWGVVATNFCKNIVLEDCALSRMDTHMGVSGVYTIRRCTLGHMGLNAIGRGALTVEDSTLYGSALVKFRNDYGSTWDGDLVIRNCRWIPSCGEPCRPHVFHTQNDGMHDFGYPCSMPRDIVIDGLHVDDASHLAGYEGLYLFTDPDGDAAGPAGKRPFPYRRCQRVTIRSLSTASGKAIRVSPNMGLAMETTVVIERPRGTEKDEPAGSGLGGDRKDGNARPV